MLVLTSIILLQVIIRMLTASKSVVPRLRWPLGSLQLVAKSSTAKVKVKNQRGMQFELTMTNQRLEDYYQIQQSCSSNEEWQKCLSFMRKGLPQSFRLNKAKKDQLKQLQRLIKDQFWNSDGAVTLRSVNASDSVWQASATRWELKEKSAAERKSDHAKLRDFISHQREAGNLNRQELVSMVPVALLDVQPHHTVLDMCASPASKTKQAIEAMMELSEGTLPTGAVVANEISPERCFRLVNSLNMNGFPNVISVNHDARIFPDIFIQDSEGERQQLRYDRIVCDQPCSGDGTIRKNPNIWDTWSPTYSNMLHRTQYEIARRGFELLKVGGLFAYSSCAMNPVENGAVLLRLLEESGGGLDVIDVSDQLEQFGMKAAPGFVKWKVFDGKEMNRFSSPDELSPVDEVHQALVPLFHRPGFDDQLRRCKRFLPHLNNCGGFFVAILRKTRPMPWEKEPEERRAELRTMRRKYPAEVVLEMKNKEVSQIYRSRKHFKFMDDSEISKEKTFLDIGDRLAGYSFFSCKAKRKISVTNEVVRNILENNPNPDLNVIGAGLKVFKKNPRKASKLNYLLDSTNAHFMLRLVGEERTVRVNKDDLSHLLSIHGFVNYTDNLSTTAKDNFSKVYATSGGGCAKVTMDQPFLDGTNLEMLAFVGKENVELRITESIRYHNKLVLQHYTDVGL